MSVVAITSSRTSPGATTLAAGLAIAWSHQCERSVLIEADPAGGVLSLRFDLAPAPSLSTFGSDIRNGYSSDLVWSNTQDMRGVRCIPAPVDPRLASSWTERVTPALVENLATLGAPTVIDLGWVGEDGHSLGLAQAADITLVVTTAHTAEAQALLFQVRQLKAVGANVALVVVGDRPNDPQEIAALAGIPLAAVLPDDRDIAAALAGADFSPKKFRRSLLWRTMSGLAASLLDEELMLQRSATAMPAPVMPAPVIPAPVIPATAIPAPVMPAPVIPATGIPAPVMPAPEPRPPMPTYNPDRISPLPTNESATYEPLDPEPTVVMPRELVLSNGERHILVAGDPVTIGRHSSCDIVVKDSEVSRHHGTFAFTEQGWTYFDNGSRNGSRVNGERCVESVLTINDELVIGQTRLAFKSLAASYA